MVVSAGYNDFTVILPTLNEQDNIQILISNILRHYKGIRIVVVDDGSSDKTREYVLEFCKNHSGIRLLDRARLGRKRGLTASVVDAIAASNTRYVIVMDADMQHPYAKLKEIAELLKEKKELVVGVRTRTSNWKFYRKVISKALIGIGYVVLTAKNEERCNDIFSGFFGVDRKLFMRVYTQNKKRFVPEGFKVLYDMLKCLDHNSISIAEVPYVFINRKKDKSKAGISQGFRLMQSFVT
jgi:dolichol-phosphate mannosyltransferase